jgi:hypothetical protein
MSQLPGRRDAGPVGFLHQMRGAIMSELKRLSSRSDGEFAALEKKVKDR